MKLDHYPPQEPLSPLGAAYQARVLALGEGVAGEVHAYGADPYQTLTVFRPEAPSGEVLVFFHGGGWTSGYKEWMYFMAPALLAQGVTFASAGYRLAPGHLFPSAFEDAADAVAWVWRRIGEEGGDPRRIFVGGHSAGGHYAALLAVTARWRAPRSLPPGVLRGCLPVSGVYRLGADSGIATRPRFLGTNDVDRVDTAASPIAQIDPATCAPFLITHGSRDFPHLMVQARQMEAALRAAGVPVQTHVLEGADHFEASVACGERPAGWPALAAAWMRQTAASPIPSTGVPQCKAPP